jgi:hypothetical protein
LAEKRQYSIGAAPRDQACVVEGAEGGAGRIEAQGEDILIPAGTAYCGLDPILQSPTPSSSAWSRFRG